MRPATPADIRWICETMWERGRVELLHWPVEGGALGIHPRDWLQGWYDKIASGDAVAFGPEKPHAILGCDSDCTTYFQASSSFEAPGVGLKVTKEIRRAIPQLMRERGIEKFTTYSLCVHPESEKWFRLLGLTEDTKYHGPQCGPFLLRRFIRR